MDDLKDIAKRLRRQVVRMHHKAQVGHLGSSLSCIDILVAAYWRVLQPGDRFILSKGHAASALYAVLAAKGLIAEDELETFAQDGSRLTEHPPVGLPGVEFAGGSLGHGLPIGVGMTLANRLAKVDHRVFVLMSDGETNEGSVWEAASFAAARGLSGLCVIVDANGLQGIGRSRDNAETLRDKFISFGWHSLVVDGHDIHDLVADMDMFESFIAPCAIIAQTHKGWPISSMCDNNLWHYRAPDDRELEIALTELA